MTSLYERYLKLLNIINMSGVNESKMLQELESLTTSFVDESSIHNEHYFICHKKGFGEKILLSAEILEPYTFVANGIKKEGLIEFTELYNRALPSYLIGTNVKFQHGVIGTIRTKNEDLNKSDNIASINAEMLYIDVGATSDTDLKAYLNIGDYGIISGTSYEYCGNKIVGPHLSSFSTLILMLEVMEILDDIATDIYFICSKWKYGLNNDLVEKINPKYIISFESQLFEDISLNEFHTPIKFDKGPFISNGIPNTCEKNFSEILYCTAIEKSISFQKLFVKSFEINKRYISTIKLPIRHSFSAMECIDCMDIKRITDLLKHIITKIQEVKNA